MKNISEILDNQTKTLSDGLKMNDGAMNTPYNNMNSKKKEQPEIEQATQSQEGLDWTKRLGSLLSICYDSLDTYGKKPEQLVNSSRLFKMVLADYSIEQIEEAFKIYLKKNSVMPKPADIVQIIEPPKEKRKWCKVAFLEIKRKKRENVFTTFQEDQYCEDFLKAAISGDLDEREYFNSAIEQVKIEDKKYWLE